MAFINRGGGPAHNAVSAQARLKTKPNNAHPEQTTRNQGRKEKRTDYRYLGTLIDSLPLLSFSILGPALVGP